MRTSVSSDVVYHQSEKWGERSGAAKSSRPWQLPDGLVNVAQTSAGHGEARAGEIVWRGSRWMKLIGAAQNSEVQLAEKP